MNKWIMFQCKLWITFVFCVVVFVAATVFVPIKPTVADTPRPSIIHLSGNEQGQSVLVYATAWGQVVVTVYDEYGNIYSEEYTTLGIDADTTGVMVDVCGDNVYLVESGDTIRYYHLELTGVSFVCYDRNFTLWVPLAAK